MKKYYKCAAIITIFLFLISLLGCDLTSGNREVNTSSDIENEISEGENKESDEKNQEKEVSKGEETTLDETHSNEEEQIEEPKTITITAVGDIMCHNSNLESAFDPDTGKYDFTRVFEYVKEYIEDADLAIANFETVTAGEEEKYTSFPYFNTPDSILMH